MKYTTWKLFGSYLLVLVLMVMCSLSVNGQTIKISNDLTIVHFNAGWNASNDVVWIRDLGDVEKLNCDIAKDADAQKKYAVVVVPTIILFSNGEEVKRFQADISFKMAATKKEVQDAIDEVLMDSF